MELFGYSPNYPKASGKADKKSVSGSLRSAIPFSWELCLSRPLLLAFRNRHPMLGVCSQLLDDPDNLSQAKRLPDPL
jgi:DNA-binding transcriptional LysR family regulator